MLTDDRAFGNYRNGPGQPGVFYAAWNSAGADVDSLGYLPEPATLSLLAPALPSLLARRRRT